MVARTLALNHVPERVNKRRVLHPNVWLNTRLNICVKMCLQHVHVVHDLCKVSTDYTLVNGPMPLVGRVQTQAFRCMVVAHCTGGAAPPISNTTHLIRVSPHVAGGNRSQELSGPSAH